MSKPMHRAGRIVLVHDVTASDRQRLPDWHPGDLDPRPSLPGTWAAVVVVVAFWAAVAWWVFS